MSLLAEIKSIAEGLNIKVETGVFQAKHLTNTLFSHRFRMVLICTATICRPLTDRK